LVSKNDHTQIIYKSSRIIDSLRLRYDQKNVVTHIAKLEISGINFDKSKYNFCVSAFS